jgi:hypothetical protein
MYKYIVTFQVFIDGTNSEIGTTGSISNSSELNQDGLKSLITRHYLKTYANSKISVIIRNVHLSTNDEYAEAEKYFTQLKY